MLLPIKIYRNSDVLLSFEKHSWPRLVAAVRACFGGSLQQEFGRSTERPKGRGVQKKGQTPALLVGQDFSFNRGASRPLSRFLFVRLLRHNFILVADLSAEDSLPQRIQFVWAW